MRLSDKPRPLTASYCVIVLEVNYSKVKTWVQIVLHIYIMYTKEKEVHLYFGHPIQKSTLKL